MADYYGYQVRDLYPSEAQYFQTNRNVAGMATEDGKIIFNPYAQGVNFDAVGRNEAARLWMRENNITPKFKLTEAQKAAFKGTPYEGDEVALKQTILARILSGDPSAGDATPLQRDYSKWVLSKMESRAKK